MTSLRQTESNRRNAQKGTGELEDPDRYWCFKQAVIADYPSVIRRRSREAGDELQSSQHKYANQRARNGGRKWNTKPIAMRNLAFDPAQFGGDGVDARKYCKQNGEWKCTGQASPQESDRENFDISAAHPAETIYHKQNYGHQSGEAYFPLQTSPMAGK
jgi:hypothetical protein